MTLKSKTQMFLAAALLSALLLLDVFFTGFLVKSAEQADVERMKRDLSRTSVTLTGEARTLAAIAGNWAYSDKAWDYMKGLNPDYPHIYLNRTVLTEIGISSLIFLDVDLNVKFARDYSAPDDSSTPESELEALFADKGSEIFNSVGDNGLDGIVMKGEKPIFFAVKPIRRSDQGGEKAGYLIATMALSPKMTRRLADSLNFDFAVTPVPQEQKSASGAPDVEIASDAKNNQTTGRQLIRDHAGVPAFWISGVTPNIDTTAAWRKMQQLFLVLAAAALAIVFIFGKFMNGQVTSRVNRLAKEIESIRDDEEAARVITVDGKNDEITGVQRRLSDFMAFFDYKQREKNIAESTELAVYKRFAEFGGRMCVKTLEDIATSFTPEDEHFRAAITRCASITRDFARENGANDEELMYVYMGSLFSRLGKLALPFSIRKKTTALTPAELREYKKYPIKTRDFLEEIELLRPATQIPYAWNENWDGTGFPLGLSGSAIPFAAREFAVADAWNELTRPWPGRKTASDEEVAAKLREQAGTRLDPDLVEKFIEFLAARKTQK